MTLRSALFKRNLMMIRYDHAHSVGSRKSDLGCRCDPVIAGQDKLPAVLFCLPDQMIVQPIAVPDPVRNDRIRIGSEQPQATEQNISGTDPVHIIITDNAYLRSLCDPLKKQFTRFPHSFHQKRIMQILHGSV